MKLSQLFTTRIDRCSDKDKLKKEIESLYHILFENRHNTEIRQEMVEKIHYISKRIAEINNPPSLF